MHSSARAIICVIAIVVQASSQASILPSWPVARTSHDTLHHRYSQHFPKRSVETLDSHIEHNGKCGPKSRCHCSQQPHRTRVLDLVGLVTSD